MKKFTSQKHSLFELFLFILLLTANKNISAQNQNALDFDGVDDYVTVPNGSAFISGSAFLSLTMWVYPINHVMGFPDFDGFAGMRNNLDADFYILQYSDSTVEARFRNNTGQNFDIMHSGLQLNTWQHYALTYDNMMMRLYLNGQAIDSVAATGVITNVAELFYLGNQVYNGTNYYYMGKLDEVSLWSRKLEPDEINCIYHNGIDSADTGLKLYFKCNQGIAGGNNTGITSLIDSKGNSNGTFNNMAMTGATSNFLDGVFNNISIVDTICQGESYVFGSQILTATGIYQQHFSLVTGCDSVVELNLTVTPLDTSVSLNGATLTANQSGAAYQWLDCHTGLSIISGATSQSYSPTSPGSFAVIVTINGCTDTSDCHLVTNVGVSENTSFTGVSVFPNPLDKQLTINLGKIKKNISIFISDNTGRELFKSVAAGTKPLQVNTSAWMQGIYVLKIISDNEMKVVKLVKQ